MKKIFVYIVLIIIVVVVVLFFIFKKEKPIVIEKPPAKEAIAMCYQYSKETSRGFVDRAWLKLNILDTNITGEYQNLPAEKDSKVGIFTGTVGPMDPQISGRIADVWWDSMGEGMQVMEQLKIEFGEGSASVLFGEMLDRGDGIYVYKDVSKLTPGFQMWQIDCEKLDDMIVVEKYIRDNIKTIVSEKPVLGGSWYATVINVNPITDVNSPIKTGTVMLTYEDGHIQKKAEFSYTRNGAEVIVNLIDTLQKKGEICGAGIGNCQTGLKCGYPCGIQGCQNVCMDIDELPKP